MPYTPRGYLTLLKAAIVDALQATMESNFIDPDLRGTRVSIEFPIEEQHYPSIWVNYDDQESLSIAGIDHREYVYEDPDDDTSPQHETTRWTFGGEVTLTVVAFSSLERDNLYDELVRVYAFSRVEHASTEFRQLIETNDFLVINVDWDELRPHGDGAAPGTPWGDDSKVIYERSIGFDIMGEFVSDPSAGEMVLLSRIVVKGYNADAEDPDDGEFILGVPRPDTDDDPGDNSI